MPINVKLTCLGPVHHGAFGEDAGNASLFRRAPIVSLDGMPEVPVMSGNAIRGILRRILVRDLFDRCKITKDSVDKKDYQKLYAAVANGGHLDGGSATSLDTTFVQDLRRSVPVLSLFGAALYKWQIPGRLLSTFLWPHCEETHAADLVPDSSGGKIAEELITDVSHSRHIEREEHQPDISGVTPMPTTVEALATGTVLSGEFWFLGSATEIEQSALAWGLERVRIVGGKGAGGLGRVQVEHDGDATAYTEWLEGAENIKAASSALRELPATF